MVQIKYFKTQTYWVIEENFGILLYSEKSTTCGHLFRNVPRSKVRDLATANGIR